MKRAISIILLFIVITTICTACLGKKSARTYYKEGMKDLEDEKYKEAETSLLKAVQLKPEKAEYYISYGMVLIKNEKIDKALIQLDKAIIDKDNKIVKENNKIAYRGKGIAYFTLQEYKNAIIQFDKALEIDELDNINMDILLYKSEAQEKSGLYEEVIKTYSSILEKEKSALIYGKKAVAEQKLLQYDAAKKDYDKAIKLDSNNYDLYLGKYDMLKEQNKEKEAAEVLKEVLEIKPKTAEDFYYVAKAKFLQGDNQTAKKGFKKAVNDKILEANFYLGQIAQSEEDYSLAAEYYQKYIEAFSDLHSAKAYNQIGICYLKLERYEEALEKIQQGIALNDTGQLRSLFYNEIIVLEHLGEYAKAQKKAKKYIKLYPEDKEMKKEYQFIYTRTYQQE